ncbi:hypothetical protein FHW69_003499 [Luteibacter sp. Sphag1AF]|uniref:hypothetical protein n=1 Tax=Luteibacter sp. Sphag1AF TaxID=2587031 RepID=UPI00161421E7|nr:hypothetical protein [Luteibacter sp. Sphag1AF]MBB3228854.1 hypothetical protein [Luteibacter sp. Sphag1AF]
MKSFAWLRLAGVVVGMTVAAVLAVAVPAKLWNSSSVAAAVTLVLSVGGIPLFLLPTSGQAHRVSTSWLAGAAGAWTASLLLVAVGGVLAGFSELAAPAWDCVFFWYCLLALGWVLMHAATGTFAQTTAQRDLVTFDARSQWASQLWVATPLASDDDGRHVVRRLVERVQYAVRDGQGDEHRDADVMNAINAVVKALPVGGDMLAEAARRLDLLMEQRDQEIRAARACA